MLMTEQGRSCRGSPASKNGLITIQKADGTTGRGRTQQNLTVGHDGRRKSDDCKGSHDAQLRRQHSLIDSIDEDR